jgi:hypothetical protein
MTEHTGYPVALEYLEVALARAIEDQAVVQFATLPLLLAQLPEDLRREVSRAFDVYKPFDDVGFFLGHLQVDTVVDGTWCVCRLSGLHKGYGFFIAGDQDRYEKAIMNLQTVFATQATHEGAP